MQVWISFFIVPFLLLRHILCRISHFISGFLSVGWSNWEWNTRNARVNYYLSLNTFSELQNKMSCARFQSDTVTSHSSNRDQIMDQLIHLFESLHFAIYANVEALQLCAPKVKHHPKSKTAFKFQIYTKHQTIIIIILYRFHLHNIIFSIIWNLCDFNCHERHEGCRNESQYTICISTDWEHSVFLLDSNII